MIFLQLFVGGTDIEVALWIEGEVAAREGSVRALGLVHQFHMRLDSALVPQPPNHLSRAVTCVGDQARRSDFELFGRAVERRLAAPTSAWRTVVVASTSMITARFRSMR